MRHFATPFSTTRPPEVQGPSTGPKKIMTSFASRAALGLLLAIGAFSSAAADEEEHWEDLPHHLGQNLSIPQRQLNVGGYLNVHYADLEGQKWKFGLRDISLFISKTIPNRWQLFSEVELGDALEFSHSGVSSSDSEIDLERLYADYRATPTVNFRFGKYLTPVGRWNLIHADPLVWTADRPLTTAAPFARHATGAMIYGDMNLGDDSLEYSLYADDSELLDPLQKREWAFEDDSSGISPRNAFKQALGGRLVYHLLDEAAAIGVSYLRMEMYDLQERKELLGVDAVWTVNRMEFSGEWIYRNSLGSSEKDEHGGFIQAVLPLPEHLFLIGRHEKYRAAVLPPTATIDSVGITYRPHDAVSVKLEHRDGRHNQIMAPSGWLGSLAILF